MNDNQKVMATGVADLLAGLPSGYEKPEISVFSAQTLEQAEMQLVTGESPLSEDGDYYY